jgi:hypothetical protein
MSSLRSRRTESSNQKVSPIQVKEFVQYIQESDTYLVTVGEETYRVYRYEGALKDLDDAVVLFSWKAGRTDSNKKTLLRFEHGSGTK